MKKILALLVLSIAMVSCYEDYILDYVYTAVYFPFQQDVRTFVVGEGMKFEVGAALGGVKQNTVERNVSFILDPALITPARLKSMKLSSWAHINGPTASVDTLKLLPTSYYQMTPSTTKMVIKSGWHNGTVVIKADSAVFLGDSAKTVISKYVLPFSITGCSEVDSILPLKSTNVVGVKFENKLFGNYWHGGAALVHRTLNPNLNQRADTTLTYKTTIPCLENLIWTFTTQGPSTLTSNGYHNKTVSLGKKMLKLTLKGNNIILTSGPDAPAGIGLVQDGACTFNNNKLLQNRKIVLKYTYTETASPWFTYHCTDTLTFRNRIRDGINEWQDENPSHYTK